MEDQSLKAKEILFYVILGLILAAVPYLVAWGVTDSEHVFFGAVINVDDFKAYLSAIQQGSQGSWLFHYNFTPEHYSPQLMYSVYILIGKLAGFLGGKNIIWLHASRLVFGTFTFFAFRFWVQSIFPRSKPLQRTAWILISFGSGFGLFVIMFGWVPGNLPLDLTTPELNTITNLVASPHYILAVGLLAVYFGALQQISTKARTWKWAVIASLAGLGIGLVYPYQIPLAGLATGLWLIVIAIRHKQIPWNKWAQGAIVLTPLIMLLIYYALIARQDALWERTFVDNHGLPSPSPWKLFLAFGLLAVFGILAIFWEMRNFSKSDHLLPVIWAVANLLVIFLPFPFALRLVLGLHIPLATLAGLFFEGTLLPRLEKVKISRPLFLVLSIPSTLLFIFFVTSLVLGENSYPQYYPKNELAAADWLAAQVEENDLTLANYHIGGYLPTAANTRVFMGQFAITVAYQDKIALTEKFWGIDTPQTWRDAFVEQWGITYIYQGNEEMSASGEWIELPWEIIYSQDGVTIYSVE